MNNDIPIILCDVDIHLFTKVPKWASQWKKLS